MLEHDPNRPGLGSPVDFTYFGEKPKTEAQIRAEIAQEAAKKVRENADWASFAIGIMDS